MPDIDRWTLPDMDKALDWVEKRNSQGIRCSLDILGEAVDSEDGVRAKLEKYEELLKAMTDRGLNATISIKPSSLGARFDEKLAEKSIYYFSKSAGEKNVSIEIDMEGSKYTQWTIYNSAFWNQRTSVTTAVQAYLDRAEKDIRLLQMGDVRVRLVKGAYQGDLTDHSAIRERFLELYDKLLRRGNPFCVGTHDRQIIETIWDSISGGSTGIEVGFLKGFADRTKMKMASEGIDVIEYVPFGDDARAYVFRREKYLRELYSIGLEPID